MGKRGGAGTVYADKPAQEKADGTVVKSFQRMPTQLLLEWTQREKRPKPWYNSVRSWERGKFRQKVYLEDPKKKEASLEFEAANDSESLFEAKEHCAMVALLKVQGTLPLERKLPDPYAELWKASVAAAAASAKFEPKARAKAPAAKAAAGEAPAGAAAAAQPSTAAAATAEDAPTTEAKTVAPLRAMSSFVSQAEKSATFQQRDAERRRERNKREAAIDNRRRANANAPILLSKRMRSQLYAALGLSEAYGAGADESEVDDMDEAESAAVSRCEDWGFARADILRAVAALRDGNGDGAPATAEVMRKWLCLHVPEEELPEEFAAGRGQFEVYRGGVKKQAATGDGKTLYPDSCAVERPAAEVAMDELFAWLQHELARRLGDADSEAMLLSLDLVLRGVDWATADEAELEEAGENAVAVLESEGDKTDGMGPELLDRWRGVVAIGRAAVAPDGSDPGGDGTGARARAGAEEKDADDATSTAASTTDARDCDGFWEETCGAAPRAASAGGGSAASSSRPAGRQPPARCWFGGGHGARAAAAYEAWLGSGAGQRMQRHRDGLPSARSREELLKLVVKSQVVLVQGETGCGKTTQVGQFLVDAGADARVVVTQPRRVAAVSVAQRVADERGECLGQGVVGYSVRGETVLHRESCRLLFCTNGILLRRLLGQPDDMFSERTCTHLVIDEVHERSVEIDLLLTLLAHKLVERPNLRVLLMSATMDVEQLSSLFPSRPPIVKIPGRTFPVAQLYLEDAEDQLGMFSKLPGGDDDAWDDASAAPAPLGRGAPKQRYLAPLDFSMLAKLVVAAVRGEFKDGPKEGAVLVFVPGVGEISRLIAELQRTSEEGGPRLQPLPLHGALPPDQQRRCFEVPAKGAPRKVVVSTNVAETSVTVPDVTVVIDTARERRLCLDPGAVAPCLAERLCAQTSLRQRKGRAGRVQAGLCLTLLPRREALALPSESPPEIEAAALETLCLQVRVAGFEPADFLARAPTPPAPPRVAAAERMLLKIGATRPAAGAGVAVAALGRHLAALPCDVHTGKLLVLGAFLGVASAAADIAAMLSVRSPLKSTQRDAAAEAYRTELRASLRPGGGKSDHCLSAKLMQLWHEDRTARGRRELCIKAGLAYERMAEAAAVRAQLVAGLRGLGFAPGAEDDRCGADWRALRAAVCAAFYPQVARVDRPPKEYIDGLAGAIEKQAEARKLRYYVLTDAASDAAVEQGEARAFQKHEDTLRAFLHPSSGLFKEASYSCPYVVYSSKQAQEAREDLGKPARLNLSDASEASVFALLLFGGGLQVDTHKNEVLVDRWIAFSGGSTTVVALVEKLRQEIDALLLRKIESPRLSVGSAEVARAVGTLISTDGLG